MATTRHVLACIALAAVTACDLGLQQPITRGDVGNAGGTLTVSEGLLTGTSITVPPGAMPRTLELEIIPRAFTETPDTHSVAPGAADFQPYGLRFSSPATLTLRFDTGRVPSGTADGDFIVKRRDNEGRIVEIVPDSVDQAAGTLTAKISSLATFWVAVIVDSGHITLADYLPLDGTNRYEFDNDLAITVSTSMTRPNLEGTTVRVFAITGNFLNQGFYLARSGGTTISLGRFARFQSYQELQNGVFDYLAPIGRLGASTSARGTYVGYEPWGSRTQTYSGTETLTVELVTQGSLQTPLGTFDDVLELAFTSTRTNSGSTSESQTDRLWLARDVGPVQIDFPDLAPIGSAKRITLNGAVTQPARAGS